MEIARDLQVGRDFDWFCVDEKGHIGHFTTAGFKYLPKSVEASAENLETLTKFFMALQPQYGHEVDLRLADALNEPKPGPRYLRDFVAMADRGLFSFDIESYATSGSAYFRVALPLRPLKIEDLPEPIRKILTHTVLAGRLLSTTARIPYDETLEM